MGPSALFYALRVARVGATFALAGWLATLAILVSNANTSIWDAFNDTVIWQGALAALSTTILWGPVLAWSKLPRFLAPVVACLAGVTALFMYFTFWPPEWSATTWKYVGIMLISYWHVLVPAAAGAGLLAALWNHRITHRHTTAQAAAAAPPLAPPASPSPSEAAPNERNRT